METTKSRTQGIGTFPKTKQSKPSVTDDARDDLRRKKWYPRRRGFTASNRGGIAREVL